MAAPPVPSCAPTRFDVILSLSLLLLTPSPLAADIHLQDVRVRRTAASLLKDFRSGEDFVARGEAAEALMAKGRSAQKKLVDASADGLERLEVRFLELLPDHLEQVRAGARAWRERPLGSEQEGEIRQCRAAIAKLVREQPGRVQLQHDLDRMLGRLSALLDYDVIDALQREPALAATAAELEAVIDEGEEHRRYHDRAWKELADAGRDARWLERREPAPEPERWRRRLESGRRLAALEAERLDPEQVAVRARNHELGAELRAAPLEAVKELNHYRALAGLPLLEIELGLCRASDNHAADMLEHGFYAHESPVAGREEFWQRAEEEGAEARSENLASGTERAEVAVRAWWTSFGHRKAMMGPYRQIGIGRAGEYWVALFN